MTSDSDSGKESAICLKIYSPLINEADTRMGRVSKKTECYDNTLK